MSTLIWDQFGSSNALLPDGTNTLSEPLSVDLSSVRSNNIHLRAILQDMPQVSITKISLKIAYLKSYSNCPGANRLINQQLLNISLTCDIQLKMNFESQHKMYLEKNLYSQQPCCNT